MSVPLSEALGRLHDSGVKRIELPLLAVIELADCINEDLGYNIIPYADEYMFAGIEFAPAQVPVPATPEFWNWKPVD